MKKYITVGGKRKAAYLSLLEPGGTINRHPVEEKNRERPLTEGTVLVRFNPEGGIDIHLPNDDDDLGRAATALARQTWPSLFAGN